jgi:chromosome segregation ATPase
MVIPAQLELARDEMNATRLDVDNKRREVERWTNALQQGRTRLGRLQEERDQLRKEIGGEKVEEGKTSGLKQGVRSDLTPVPATPKDGGKP